VKSICVMLVAAEPSGDALGAGLAIALRARLGSAVRFVGVGGPLMAAQGVESPFDISALSVLGVSDALLAYPAVLRAVRRTSQIAESEHPDVAVLIDSWGFNLRVAHRLRRLDQRLRLIKYVGPQVWATRPGRARTLARAVDRLLTIHTFDAPLFENEGLPVTFVGNPILAKDFSRADPIRLRADLGIAERAPLLLVLPGSRNGEVERLLPPFEDAVRLLKARSPDLVVVVAAADAVASVVRAKVERWAERAIIVEGEADRAAAMKAATVALACSGTITTELALCGTPMVVAYRLGSLTHAVAKRLIRTRYITLLNVAADDFVAPELIQADCNGPALAEAIFMRLDNPAVRSRQIEAQTAALEIMRGGVTDPLYAAADAVINEIARVDPDQPRSSSA
jgi:lipid-A-disaccharide synthase